MWQNAAEDAAVRKAWTWSHHQEHLTFYLSQRKIPTDSRRPDSWSHAGQRQVDQGSSDHRQGYAIILAPLILAFLLAELLILLITQKVA